MQKIALTHILMIDRRTDKVSHKSRVKSSKQNFAFYLEENKNEKKLLKLILNPYYKLFNEASLTAFRGYQNKKI